MIFFFLIHSVLYMFPVECCSWQYAKVCNCIAFTKEIKNLRPYHIITRKGFFQDKTVDNMVLLHLICFYFLLCLRHWDVIKISISRLRTAPYGYKFMHFKYCASRLAFVLPYTKEINFQRLGSLLELGFMFL